MNNQAIDTKESSAIAIGSSQRPRLAIVVPYPIQHFCPMYRCIAAEGRMDLLVLFAEAGAMPRFDNEFGMVVKWQADILDGYTHIILTAAKAERQNAVLQELRKFRPDVVYVHGYSLDYLREAIRWAHTTNTAVLMTTDSELRHHRPWYVRAIKRIVLPPVLRKVDLFLTVGDENERYFRHYGVGKDRFHRVPFSIDSSYYDKVLSNRTEVRNSLRRRMGIDPDSVAILTAGKLIPRKRHSDLIRAFSELVKGGKGKAVLLIAGEGAERRHLEELAKPLGSSVKLLGFIGVDELPEYYLAADIYAHPSSNDPHPLTISEALYCGLPVVVSDRVGSIGATDDVQVGRNGWVYRNGDVAALSVILANLVNNPSVREAAGKISRELGQLHSSARCGALFVDGALRALAGRGKLTSSSRRG